MAQFKSDIEERPTHMEPQVRINGVPSFIREDSNSSDPIKVTKFVLFLIFGTHLDFTGTRIYWAVEV